MNKVQLPEGWEWSKLGNLADYVNGRAFKPTDREAVGLPIIRIQNLNDHSAEFNYTASEYEAKYSIRSGDLLFAWSASLGAYIWNRGDAWLNQHIFKVIPKASVDKTYLFYALKAVVNQLYAKAHGSGMVHVTKSKFEDTSVPLPPLPVQRQIVARIEELFSELDAGTQELQTALKRLKIYRQAVLQHYLSNPDWERVRLGERAEVTGGLTKNSKRDSLPLKLPYLRVANVYADRLELSEIKEVGVSQQEIKRTLLRKNDLLVVEGNGSIDQVGRVAIWDGSIENCLHQNHLIKVRFVEQIAAKFILQWMLSPQGRRKIEAQASSTSGLHTLSLSKISNLIIPFPNLDIQVEIVSEIEARLSETDAIEATIQLELVRAEKLRQSILKRAFEGKLVDQSEINSPDKHPVENSQVVTSNGQLSLF